MLLSWLAFAYPLITIEVSKSAKAKIVFMVALLEVKAEPQFAHRVTKNARKSW
jgi:hypothetical protein